MTRHRTRTIIANGLPTTLIEPEPEEPEPDSPDLVQRALAAMVGDDRSATLRLRFGNPISGSVLAVDAGGVLLAGANVEQVVRLGDVVSVEVDGSFPELGP
jgi:hypothetical protein